MNNLPVSISLLFGLTTLLTIGLFYKAAHSSKITLVVILAWILFQSSVGLSGFYTVTNTIPPRFLLLVTPPMALIVLLFSTSAGRNYLDNLDLRILTILHVIRIPVEIVLYLLCIHKVVPELMTFEGRNFDILSGLTAPFIFYLAFKSRQIGRKTVVGWNFVCLGLLIFIVANAVLSAPFPFQQFGFDQPDIAVLYFPFVWLPCCVVPLVLLSHAASIRQLMAGDKKTIEVIQN